MELRVDGQVTRFQNFGQVLPEFVQNVSGWRRHERMSQENAAGRIRIDRIIARESDVEVDHVC